ncbi:MAG: hypothetical protein ABF723_13715 [Lentilactobacillus hilgardii]
MKASILVVTLVYAYFAGKEWDKSSKKQNNAKKLIIANKKAHLLLA